MIYFTIYLNVEKDKAKLVKDLVQQAIDEGVDAETILSEGLLSGMSVIGEKFKNNEIYVPEVLVAACAMNKVAETAGIRDKVKIMIGGAPVSDEFCKQIGADCYTSDAASAADVAVALCKV